MYINENYNMGLLILFHLLLVAILKIVMFQYIIKPLIKQYMTKIENDLPKLNEKTLEKYNIYYNENLNNSINSVLQVLVKYSKQLYTFIYSLNNINDNNISPKLNEYLANKQTENELEIEIKNQQFNYNIFITLTAILATIVTWYFIQLKHQQQYFNILELILGNIIPLIMIFVFEIYFIKNIAINYKINGESGILYQILTKLYTNH